MKLTYQARTGHGRYKIVHKNSNAKAQARRLRALQRLIVAELGLSQMYDALEDKKEFSGDNLRDLARMRNEIKILKQKLGTK